MRRFNHAQPSVLVLTHWLSSNKVTPRPTRLVLGWVTVCRWKNHFGM